MYRATRCGDEIYTRSEGIGEGRFHRTRVPMAFKTIFKLLEEKQGVLKALDDKIVATCPEDIGQKVQEAEEVYEKVMEALAAIDQVE